MAMRPPVGREEFPAVPILVDRGAEIDRIRSALDAAGTAQSPLLLIRGEAGTGKTRLIQEAMTEAERRGRSVVVGTARAESTAPYHLWVAPLRHLSIDYLLEEAPPPRLMGLYLLDAKGHPLVSVEREPEGKLSSRASVTTTEPDLSGPGRSVLGGGLSVLDRGGRRLLVLERPEVRLCAAVEGHEDEVFVEDLRKLAVEVDEAVGATHSFKDLLSSGKYEGIDYAKGDPKLRQSRLFQNAALGLARNVELRPLLFVLDDLQWADPSSLALLEYVARNLRQSNALFLGAYRVEEGSVRPHLREALERMAREGLIAELSLGGLSRRDLGPLAESFIGSHGLPKPFLDVLWSETEGNPLIVREVLRGLEEDKAIELHGASKKLVAPPAEVSIPNRVREAVRTRLERVPKEDRRLLEAAAACGTRFTAAMVARLVGQAEGNVLNGFGSISGVHGFLRGGESEFTFDHPAVREVLYDDMGDDVRRVYHREAADWLELAGGPPEDVADHLYRARDPRAAERLRQVAETARERYANAEAIRFYTEALGLESDPDTRRGMLRALGSIQALLGDFEAALASLANAQGLVKTSRERAGIVNQIGNIRFRMGEYDTALKDCASALPLVEMQGTEEEAAILYTIGIVRCETGSYDPALEYLHRSSAISERIGDRKGVAKALNSIGLVHLERGEHNRGLEYLTRGLDLREEIGDTIGVAGSLNNIGIAQCVKGDYDRGVECFGRSVATWEKVGDPSGMAGPLVNMANVYRDRGDYERALEFLRQGLALVEKLGDLGVVAKSLGALGALNFEQRSYDQALQYYDRCLTILERIGDRKAVARTQNSIGRVHWKMGDYDAALDRLHQALDIEEEIGDQGGVAETLVDLAELALGRGDLESAEQSCERALLLAEETRAKETIARAKTALGILHGRREAWQASSECFEASLLILAQLGRPPLEAKTHYEFGLIRKQAGDVTNARKHLAIAGGIFEKLHLDADLKQVNDARRDVPEG